MLMMGYDGICIDLLQMLIMNDKPAPVQRISYNSKKYEAFENESDEETEINRTKLASYNANGNYQPQQLQPQLQQPTTDSKSG